MATKTITIMEDAYNILKSRKRGDESFSDVIKRELGPHDLSELIGIFSKEQTDEMKKHIKDLRRRMRKGVDKTAKRLER